MLKPINSFSFPLIKKITTQFYLPKPSDWKAAACFAAAIGFLIILYWQNRRLTSKLLLAEKRSLPPAPVLPSAILQPETPPQFSVATEGWSIHPSSDRIIAAFAADLDPSAKSERWTSASFTLKESQFSLSIQHEQASEEFNIFLQCITPLGEVQVNYGYTLQGREIMGEDKLLDLSQAKSKHLLGKITVATGSKPPLVSLWVTLNSLSKA